MEVSGIEGSYRSTCEKTMGVLRDNKGSLVDMLEAFVHDPLISWRVSFNKFSLVTFNTLFSFILQLLNQSSGELLEDAEALPPSVRPELHSKNDVPTVSLQNASVSTFKNLPEPIDEGQEDEEEENKDDEREEGESDTKNLNTEKTELMPLSVGPSVSSQHAKSLQMFSEMKSLAANLSTSSRIQSLTGSNIDPTMRSRTDRSVRQRELLSIIDGEGANNEEALNEKALNVIRRVQDKLSGTDFNSGSDAADPSDVPEQVQRLIVQATSSENLCQLFIGWCAFW